MKTKNTQLLLFFFLLYFITINAFSQVWVDTTGDGNYVDVGATADFNTDLDIQAVRVLDGGILNIDWSPGEIVFDKVEVLKGGTFNSSNSAWKDGLNVLIVDSGTVSVPGDIRLADTVIFMGTSDITISGAMDCWTSSFANGGVEYIYIDSILTSVSINRISTPPGVKIVNNLEGFSTKMNFNGQSTGSNMFKITGEEMMKITDISFYENLSLNGTYLSVDNDVIFDGNLDFNDTRDAGNIGGGFFFSVDGNKIIFGDNFTITNNITSSPNYYQLNGKDLTLSFQANRADTITLPVKEDNGIVDLSFGKNAGAVVGDTSFVNIKYMNTPVAENMGANYLNKHYNIGFTKVTTPDFYFKAEILSADVTGELSLLKNALYDTATNSWDIGTALGADSIYHNITKAGYVTARTDLMAALSINNDTIVESVLNGAMVAFELVDALFSDTTILANSVTLTDAPSGLAVDTVMYKNDYQADIRFSYGSTNFDNDIDLKITLDASETNAATDLTDSLILKAQSNDTTLSDLTVGGSTITGFSPNIFYYEVSLNSGSDSTVAATTTDNNAVIDNIVQADSIPGTATVFVLSEDGHDATYTVSFKLITDVEVITTEQIKLYPVPADDQLNISGMPGASLEIIDMTGKTVITINEAQVNETIDVSGLSGVYFVKINKEEVRKVIIK